MVKINENLPKSHYDACTLVYPRLSKEEINREETIVGFPKVTQKVVDGKVVNQVEFVVETKKDRKFNIDDFAIENLLAAGVDLKPMSFDNLGLNSIDSIVSDVEPIKE